MSQPPPSYPATDADGAGREHHGHGDGVQAVVVRTANRICLVGSCKVTSSSAFYERLFAMIGIYAAFL